jgi:hypothetical protein
MSKLTSVAVQKLKTSRDEGRREVPDHAVPGLRLVIQPSGRKSWAMRFRGPGGRHVKLTLGTCDETGAELDGEPVQGGHLTLQAARKLAAEVHRQRALGRDPSKRDKGRPTLFAAAARQWIEEVQRDRKRNRTWKKQARDVFGLVYRDGVEPEVRRGSIVDRWRDRPVSNITARDVRELIRECRREGVPGRVARQMQADGSREREMSKAMSGLLKWLATEELIDGAALAGVLVAEKHEDRERVLTDDELAKLWRALEGRGVRHAVGRARAGVVHLDGACRAVEEQARARRAAQRARA